MTTTDTPQEQTSLSRRDFLKATGLSAAGMLLGAAAPGFAASGKASSQGKLAPTSVFNTLMALPTNHTLTARNFDTVLTSVDGLSQTQLTQHIGLYQGYVKKANEIHQLLATATPDAAKVNATYDPFRELLVESSFAMNGVIWHELYFDNLGGTHAQPSAELKALFAKSFGSWDGFINQLTCAGKAMRGWAVVNFNLRDNRIHLNGLDTHNQWAPIHMVPLLVLDVYEHAYMIDFGTNRGNYLTTFLKNVNWAMVEQRVHALPVHR
jgi:superoxide dismutase, Fe-Mn family